MVSDQLVSDLVQAVERLLVCCDEPAGMTPDDVFDEAAFQEKMDAMVADQDEAVAFAKSVLERVR